MTDRLDKQWQEKGLKSYSTEAIIGTLEHYGVSIDPRSFKAQAELAYPLTIAQSWMNLWKGTGKFARLPGAAVEELWRRLAPDLLQPLDVVDALTQLMKALIALRQKQDTAAVDAKFDAMDASLKKLPPEGERREHFMAEVVMVLSGTLETLDLMAEGLAKDGHAAAADRFVGVEEALFPVRKGVSAALVVAAKGDPAAAVAALKAIAEDTARDEYAQLSAIDALIHLRAADTAIGPLGGLGDRADKANDGELLAQLDRRWHALADTGSPAALAGLRTSHQRMERFGGHRHHHH